MSSNHVHITDFSTQIPGEINNGQWEFPEILTKNRLGKDRFWQQIVLLEDKNNEKITLKHKYLTKLTERAKRAVIISNSGYVNGKTTSGTVPTYVTCGKNIGKINETNMLTQALRDALGKYNKQLVTRNMNLDEESAKESSSRATNLISCNNFSEKEFLKVLHQMYKQESNKKLPPMLLKKYETRLLNNAGPNVELFVQHKKDGTRAVAMINNNNVILYSRKLNDYKLQSHIKEAVGLMLEKFPCIQLDGELYCEGESLQDISGSVRQETVNSKNRKSKILEIEFHIFDIFISQEPKIEYRYRKKILDYIYEFACAAYGSKISNIIKLVPTFIVKTEDEIIGLRDQFINNGLEGAVLRFGDRPYTFSMNNYHCAHVLKLKKVQSDEFECVGMCSGKKGKNVDAIMFICNTNNPDKVKQFTVDPENMTYPERVNMFNKLSRVTKSGLTVFDRDYKGKLLTVNYMELSKDLVPIHAKFVSFRDYE